MNFLLKIKKIGKDVGGNLWNHDREGEREVY